MQQVATSSSNVAALRIESGESGSDRAVSESKAGFSEHFRQQRTSHKENVTKQQETTPASQEKVQSGKPSQGANADNDERQVIKAEASAEKVQPEQAVKQKTETPKAAATSSESLKTEKAPQDDKVQTADADKQKSGSILLNQDKKSDDDQFWLNVVQELADRHASEKSDAKDGKVDTDSRMVVDSEKAKTDSGELGLIDLAEKEKRLDAEGETHSVSEILQQLGLDAAKVMEKLTDAQQQKLQDLVNQAQGSEATSESADPESLLNGIANLLAQSSTERRDSNESEVISSEWLNDKVKQVLAKLMEGDDEGPDKVSNNASDSTVEREKLTGQDKAGLAKVSSDMLTAILRELQSQDAKGPNADSLTPEQLQAISDKLARMQSQSSESRSNGAVMASSNSKAESSMAADNALVKLLEASDKQLDKMLTSVKQGLVQAEEGDNNAFISSLKAGLEEFKAQVKQGREPGMDLKALVAQALTADSSSEKQARVLPETVQRVSSLLESVSLNSQAGGSASFTEMDNLTASFSAERSAVGQMEASASMKTSQSQQTPAGQMERAINIAKSEAAQQLADRVRMLVDQGNMSADIRLDPPDLGSMQIRVQMNGEQASVSMTVQNQQAKEMLDQAMPRLRELLSEKGIELGQSSVEQEQKQAKDGDTGNNGDGSGTEGQEGELSADDQQELEMAVVNGRPGGIDYFV